VHPLWTGRCYGRQPPLVTGVQLAASVQDITPSLIIVACQLIGHPLIRSFARGGRVRFCRSSWWSILHRRDRVLLPLTSKLTFCPEPVVLRIAGAALTLPDLVRPLPDSLILAGGDSCGRHGVGHVQL
jgi:hypothetical protein